MSIIAFISLLLHFDMISAFFPLIDSLFLQHLMTVRSAHSSHSQRAELVLAVTARRCVG